ncbi:MAG: NAD(P)H-dependent glycerol-3-phosphate dehydrogenase [Oscillatoria sp. PMC 1051.18]|uniref:NAD(P)H-dependent glycerol-3-phosphate dehydrogenase n=1 Tax=Oscillatoria salina TaxID=331517 RepID=UPI0013B93569|nr:NAD(P)H-dependent glycerol-3-phosphate dehydrogenase [Oscillatoria salina]MBZ8181235.1 NAD(P)H-dependent glycerol-3-phosphate dehydrogenase [Oscillatoria salina IIICB1]MEC4893914.1 NAD(P)H-dependent glycerol-3-phosphate dehydrogenase [Oscillatoria sp. PMC 1050.18]MEC5033062.1 NAD(P)H-dependent glycerol-3-phosphate dehydrogenase [Oscillatoria sp. PMC 1051.18]NET91168.1 NAD(P)H-dependent glycerol-3-phosphate dehydrogenase [Kamptonema sp. SIO1D9]
MVNKRNVNTAKTLTVVGAGAWGSTLAQLAAYNVKVRLWSRSSEESLEDAIAGADFILSAVSMQGVRPTIAKLEKLDLSDNLIIISATKGLDPVTTHTPSLLWQEAFPQNAVVVISGPNLSKEIQQELPAATVVASKKQEAVQQVQEIFASEIFRVYANSDPLGTELGGTLKNVMAIAAGVCDGLQLGTNAKAALLTRALPEMVRIGTTLGATVETFFGLSGLGDLLATCSSSLSRNYQVGYGLAQGKSVEQLLTEIEGTAEGVYTTKVVIDLAQQQDISVPISQQVYLLLEGKISPREAVISLMERELKSEFSDLFA